jgi:glutathionylspermidine synthase
MSIPFRIGNAVDAETFRRIRLRTIFECCKYDPQVEDTPVLAPYPILMGAPAWTELARLAEGLARETLAAEREILGRVELLKQLALPRGIWKLLARGDTPAQGPRVMRFDFHFTSEGWRISEVNSDVPGGFIEADGFTRLMSEVFPGCCPAGLPGGRLAEALVQSGQRPNPTVAMVHATAYSDDRQVNQFLGRLIQDLGGTAVLVDPTQIQWENGRAMVQTEWFEGEAHALFRFFPAEWLPNLRGTCAWAQYFAGGVVPQTNPASALISQSKRFGVLLRELKTEAPLWRRLLPETLDPREAGGSADWVLKPALGRVGEGIGLAGATGAKEWRQIRRSAFLFPAHWVAQKRFNIVAVQTPSGPRQVCLGVYTVDERAAGIYARASASPIINQNAQEAAVLIEETER